MRLTTERRDVKSFAQKRVSKQNPPPSLNPKPQLMVNQRFAASKATSTQMSSNNSRHG